MTWQEQQEKKWAKWEAENAAGCSKCGSREIHACPGGKIEWSPEKVEEFRQALAQYPEETEMTDEHILRLICDHTGKRINLPNFTLDELKDFARAVIKKATLSI